MTYRCQECGWGTSIGFLFGMELGCLECGGPLRPTSKAGDVGRKRAAVRRKAQGNTNVPPRVLRSKAS